MLRISILLICLLIIGCQSTARFRAQRNKPVVQSGTVKVTDLESFVHDWLGVPYKFGGNTRQGIDCSGFTSLAYQQCFHKSIPRKSSDQFEQGRRVAGRNLRTGDLLFFSNVRYGNVDHVGIYLDDDRFAHATESDGVTISQLSEDYYAERFIGACRY